MIFNKSELLELQKSGKDAIIAKLDELRLELNSTTLKATRGEIKNVRTAKLIRRTIAQLKTIMTQLNNQVPNNQVPSTKN